MIYLDCSLLYREPFHNTGIQRVTRSIIREAMAYRKDIFPAVIHDDGVFYRLTGIPVPGDAPLSHRGEPIHFEAGDIYFVLDNSWVYKIPERLSPLKIYGVTTGVLYYDLIPITHAHVCGVSKDIFSEWILETAKYADFFACISDNTKEVLKREAVTIYPNRKINDDIAFSFNLGADISAYDSGYTPTNEALLRAFSGSNTYLTVSTMEPRKNHAMTLNAFDMIWQNFPNTKLCFIGKEAWMIEDVIRRIRSHPKLNGNLFWFEGLNDKDVQWAYRNARCVLYPSFEEGFGLPIIESLHCGTPVIASDIPVFHEVAGERIGYLDPYDPMSLANWVERIEQIGVPKEIMPDGSFKWATWKESAEELTDKIFLTANAAKERVVSKLKRQTFEQELPIRMDRMKKQLPMQNPALKSEDVDSGEPVYPIYPIHKPEPAPVPVPGQKNDVSPVPSEAPRIEALPISKLITLGGRELVQGAYLRILRRMPDPEGEEIYLDMLQNGLTPLELISTLRFSKEGRKAAEPVKYKTVLYILGIYMRIRRLPRKITRYLRFIFPKNKTKDLPQASIIELQERETLLIEQNLKYQEQTARLLDCGAKLQEQEYLVAELKSNNTEQKKLLADLNSRIQEQGISLLERDTKIQEYAVCSLDHELKLQNQEAYIAEQNTRIREKENSLLDKDSEIQEYIARLLDQSHRLQEQQTHLSEKETIIQEQDTRLLEQNTIIQEHVARLLDQSHRLYEQETYLSEKDYKIQEQDTRLLEQNSIIQEHVARLLDQGYKLQEQETHLLEQGNKLHEQENMLLEQSSKIQEQDTQLNEQGNKLHEQENMLLEQNSKIQEQDTQLNEQGNKLHEQENMLLEQSSKIQEQDTQLNEQGNKLQGQETLLLEQNSKIQEQDTQLNEQGNKLHEQETRLSEQNAKIQEQDALLIEQVSKIQAQDAQLNEQSSKIQEQDAQITEQGVKIQEQESRLTERINTLETAAQHPSSLPFSNYSESEPYLKWAEKRVGKKAPSDYAGKKEKFYTYFSEIGNENYEEVQQKHYESFLPYLPKNSKYQFLDIGCGTGKFLGYLQGHGINTIGIDADEAEIARCLKRGLIAQQAEAIDYLKKHDGLFSGMSLLHVIEHIPQEQHIELLSLANEKLSDDGVLIIENINPLHPLAFSGFFSDPAHIRPISVDYLAFMAQWCGFKSIGSLNLQPMPILPGSATDNKLHYYNYALVARKKRVS